MKINYTRLPLKAHYFFFMGAIGAIVPYVSVYGKQLGISSLIMGSIIAILPIASLINKLIFGYIEDYFYTRRKVIFMALLAITGICYTLMYFLRPLSGPILPDHPFQNVSCESLLPCDKNHHASAVASCNGTKDTTCHWMCKETNFSMQLSFYAAKKKAIIISSDTSCLLNVNESLLCQKANYNCNTTCDNFEDNQCLYTSITFWGFVALRSFGYIGEYVSHSISDAICFDVLGKDGQEMYGRQRLWGSIGFSILSFISGYTIELWSQGEIYKTYTPAFILVLIFICIDLICCKKLTVPLSKSPSILKDVHAILKLTPIIIFLCFVILSGILHSFIQHFLLWYMEDLAMATGYMSKIKLIQGLTLAMSFLGSKGIFYFMSGKILKKFGHDYTLAFCFLSYALRMGLISLAPTPWYVVLIEFILEGPSFVLLYVTIVTYASVISPSGTSATVQAIAAGMKDGLGYAIGGFLSGFLYENFGGSTTLRIYSGAAALCALVYIILYTLYLKHIKIDTRSIERKEACEESML